MFEKFKQFIEKILSFNIGTLFKAEIKNKIADNVEGNKLLEVNNDNSQHTFQQNIIALISSDNFANAMLQLTNQEKENLKFVGDKFQKLLIDSHIPQEKIQEKIANPEVIDSLKNAGRIAKKTSNIEMQKELSDLIYKKIMEDNEEESLIISSAIAEMENITHNHLQMLAFLYIVQETAFSKYSVNEFIDIYNKCLIKLINFEKQSAKRMSYYLTSSRVIDSRAMGWGIETFLPNFDSIADENIKNTIDEISKKLKEKADNINFTGIILTPIGEQIAKIYLFNEFGFVPDKKVEETMKIKDFADDVSAKELNNTIEKATKNMLTYEIINDSKYVI